MSHLDGNGNGVNVPVDETVIANVPEASAMPTEPEPEPAPVKPRKAKAAAKPAKKAKPAAKAAKPAKKAKAKSAKAAKPKKPRQVNPETVDEFGLRKGSIKSKAAAMYSRKEGATLAEVKSKLGSVQYNVIKQLVAKGHKLRTVEEVNKKSGRKASRFHLSAKK
jgi:outer membrane biosynthesis protein TonB